MKRKLWRRTALLALLLCAVAMTALAANAYATLRYRDSGEAVVRLQKALNQLGYSTGGTDGKYGYATEKAVRQFQKANGLRQDGLAGDATQTLLYRMANGEAPVVTRAPEKNDAQPTVSTGGKGGLFSGDYTTLRYGSRGDRVVILQRALNDLGFGAGTADGRFGLDTQKAVSAFQKSAGLKQDGLAGKGTLTAVEKRIAGDAAAPSTPKPTAAPKPTQTNGWLIPARTLRKGDTGEDVKSVQSRLKELGYYTGTLDGKYGTGTIEAVRAFQRRSSLNPDGLAGSSTHKKLFSTGAVAAVDQATPTPKPTASPTPKPTQTNGWLIPARTLRQGYSGEDVKSVQNRLKELGYYKGSVDGSYDADVMTAVRAFQARHRLTQDGLAGSGTYTKLFSSAALSAAAATPTPDTADYPTLRKDMTGPDVTKMQQALVNNKYTLTVTGVYDAATIAAVKGFQQRNQLSADGVAGPKTLRKLYSGSVVTGDKEIPAVKPVKNNIKAPSKSELKLMHWSKEVKPLLKGKHSIDIYDPASGYSFTLHLYSLGRHADVEPMSAQDTANMMAAYNGVVTWTPRFVYVLLPNGVWTVATMHNVAHGGQSIRDNNFDGQNCVHFLRDMDEAMRNDPSYGVNNQEVLRKSWKNLTGQTVP